MRLFAALLTATAFVAAVTTLGRTVGAATTAPFIVSFHEILTAPGGVYTLPDGRQFAAQTYSTNGCRHEYVYTGVPASATSNATKIVQVDPADCTMVNRSSTSDVQTYVGVKVLRVVANGFKFLPRFTFSDVDTNSSNVYDGPFQWRDSVSSIGLADGSIVRPTLSLEPQTELAIVDSMVDKTALTQSGWPNFGAGDLPLESASYASWDVFEDIVGVDSYRGRAHVTYQQPIDDLLAFYALTHRSNVTRTYGTLVYLDGLIFPPSCQCSAGAPETRQIAVPTLTAGECMMTTRTFTPHVCDLLGTKWCRTIDVLAWRATGPDSGGTVPCASSPLTVQRYQSEYLPQSDFAQPAIQPL